MMFVLTQGSCSLRNRSLDCSTLKAPVFALLHFLPPRLGKYVHLEEEWLELTFEVLQKYSSSMLTYYPAVRRYAETIEKRCETFLVSFLLGATHMLWSLLSQSLMCSSTSSCVSSIRGEMNISHNCAGTLPSSPSSFSNLSMPSPATLLIYIRILFCKNPPTHLPGL